MIRTKRLLTEDEFKTYLSLAENSTKQKKYIDKLQSELFEEVNESRQPGSSGLNKKTYESR